MGEGEDDKDREEGEGGATSSAAAKNLNRPMNTPSYGNVPTHAPSKKIFTMSLERSI